MLGYPEVSASGGSWLLGLEGCDNLARTLRRSSSSSALSVSSVKSILDVNGSAGNFGAASSSLFVSSGNKVLSSNSNCEISALALSSISSSSSSESSKLPLNAVTSEALSLVSDGEAMFAIVRGVSSCDASAKPELNTETMG